MKLGIMQPYFFPYVGYFQLLDAVDKLVFYDDVNFIKGGWINRNFILVDCGPHRITVPLAKASPFRQIVDTRPVEGQAWKVKLLRTLRQSYAKAPVFDAIYRLFEDVIWRQHASIADLAIASVRAVLEYLELSTISCRSSDVHRDKERSGEERVLSICKREGAEAYYNLPGGRSLYHPVVFSRAGVRLVFVEPMQYRYEQFGCRFIPGLSILDLLMFNQKKAAVDLVKGWRLGW
jgi:hypothetical protein